MTDKFARQTAQHAHRRLADVTNKLVWLEKAIGRRAQFADRCHLCGGPVKRGRQTCYAHDWAEGK